MRIATPVVLQDGDGHVFLRVVVDGAAVDIHPPEKPTLWLQGVVVGVPGQKAKALVRDRLETIEHASDDPRLWSLVDTMSRMAAGLIPLRIGPLPVSTEELNE